MAASVTQCVLAVSLFFFFKENRINRPLFLFTFLTNGSHIEQTL